MTNSIINLLIKAKISKIPAFRNFYYFLYYQDWTRMMDSVAIDICTVCHAQCVYCLHQRNNLIKPQLMEFKVFTSIADILAKEKFKLIHLYLSGEPFLHPRIYDMIEYVALLKMKSSAATKLCTKIDFERLNQVLETASAHKQKVELLITIDSLNNPKAIAPGINKDIVRYNLSELSKLQKHKSAKFIFTSTVTKANEGDLNNIRSELRQYGFENWYPSHVGYFMSHMANESDIRLISEFLPTNPIYRDRFDVVDNKITSDVKTCNFMTLGLDPAGNATVCCHDMLHTKQLGNVIDRGSLRQILNSPVFKEAMRKGRRKLLDICQGCN